MIKSIEYPIINYNESIPEKESILRIYRFFCKNNNKSSILFIYDQNEKILKIGKHYSSLNLGELFIESQKNEIISDLICLLKNKHKIEINTCHDFFNLKLNKSKFFRDDTEINVLKIESIPVEELDNDFYFKIYDIDFDKEDFIWSLDEPYHSIKTEHGEILKEEIYKGKIFIDNLLYKEIKYLNFGYNLKDNLTYVGRNISEWELYNKIDMIYKGLSEKHDDLIVDLIKTKAIELDKYFEFNWRNTDQINRIRRRILNGK